MDEALTDNNLDPITCLQKAICWSVKNAQKKMAGGQPSSRHKIVDGLATNDWINQIVAGSPIEDAIKGGRNKVNCAIEYSKCSLSQYSIKSLISMFLRKMSQ